MRIAPPIPERGLLIEKRRYFKAYFEAKIMKREMAEILEKAQAAVEELLAIAEDAGKSNASCVYTAARPPGIPAKKLRELDKVCRVL